MSPRRGMKAFAFGDHNKAARQTIVERLTGMSAERQCRKKGRVLPLRASAFLRSQSPIGSRGGAPRCSAFYFLRRERTRASSDIGSQSPGFEQEYTPTCEVPRGAVGAPET